MRVSVLFFIALLIACFSFSQSPIYSFFAAGHTYGNPQSSSTGLHPPFVSYFPTLNQMSKMELGFLTGDIVPTGTAENWDAAEADLNFLQVPTHMVAGNHDISPEFDERYGDFYYSLRHRDDLFIVLFAGKDHWNISGAQLSFLETTLDSLASSVNNIFIFMHELIWWSPTNQYSNVIINYIPHYPGLTNWDSVVKPLLESYPNSITIYAGDLGASLAVSPFMYHKFNNIALIGSGMGNGQRDNIVLTEVYSDSVHHELIALNGIDRQALGELADFSIDDLFSPVNSNSVNSDSLAKIQVYPSPFKGNFQIRNTEDFALKMELFNHLGELLFSDKVSANSTSIVETSELAQGAYFLHLSNHNSSILKKIIRQ